MKLTRVTDKDLWDEQGSFMYSQTWGNGWCFKCHTHAPKQYLQGTKRIISVCDNCIKELVRW